MNVVFVGSAVDEVSDTLGFHYLHPRNRFWELLEIGGITPERMITPAERKALAEGHAQGSLSDPVRTLFVEKKSSQLVRRSIGLAYLNRRVIASSDKDKAATPSGEDLQQFLGRVGRLSPKIIAFVMRPDLFVAVFRSRYPDATDAPGLQPFRIGTTEVWLLGSTAALLRGEALTAQEDAFFALGERIAAVSGEDAAP